MRQIFVVFALLLFSLNSRSAVSVGQWQKDQLGSLSYSIYVPSSYDSSRPAALMINLHGCAQKADEFVAAGNWEPAAEQYQMIVVIPQVPNGGVMFGCWDYYGKNHSENSRHNQPLIALTEHLLSDAGLKIDRRHVFVSGLSSGGGEAIVLGCLRPDLFSGIGLSSSPALGSTAAEVQRPSITADESARVCTQLAGSHAADLRRQLASIIVADQDFIVNTGHSTINAQALAQIYGIKEQVDLDLAQVGGPNTSGKGALLLDTAKHPRVSFIVNNGIGHAWPSGKGGTSPATSPLIFGGGFINANSVNYPMHLAQFFLENNIRIQESQNLRALRLW